MGAMSDAGVAGAGGVPDLGSLMGMMGAGEDTGVEDEDSRAKAVDMEGTGRRKAGMVAKSRAVGMAGKHPGATGSSARTTNPGPRAMHRGAAQAGSFEDCFGDFRIRNPDRCAHFHRPRHPRAVCINQRCRGSH
jgi:hypothetical protein